MDFTFHNGTNGSDPWVEFYPYAPSDAAGYVFMALFGISTLAHLVAMFPFRTAYFIPLIMGGICETFGYYGRAWSHQNKTDIGSWALQEILILCAPPFIAATIYVALGHIILYFDAEHLSSSEPPIIIWIRKPARRRCDMPGWPGGVNLPDLLERWIPVRGRQVEVRLCGKMLPHEEVRRGVATCVWGQRVVSCHSVAEAREWAQDNRPETLPTRPFTLMSQDKRHYVGTTGNNPLAM